MNLKKRWAQLMSELGLKENVETYESLIAAYSESHRHYHDVSHLQMILKQFKRVEQLAENKSHVELALWFHDAIYKPFSSSNEQDSANWASDFLIANGVSSTVVENVLRLIMATLHTIDTHGNDEKLIVDIDLTVLGQSAEVYEKYTQDIRKEYRFVPSFVYKRKRREMLRQFLKRREIYHFSRFNAEFGSNAHCNLLWEINNL